MYGLILVIFRLFITVGGRFRLRFLDAVSLLCGGLGNPPAEDPFYGKGDLLFRRAGRGGVASPGIFRQIRMFSIGAGCRRIIVRLGKIGIFF